ncbi:potassium voltage-gated channel subfamily E member 4 [Heptranchias perlo]|uniref:potassium voltage-gated channel subfamily E member 4 n=1 Tax=Heptranchias perlo TaxID=212740 RepID=UPI00355978B2
MDNSNETNFPEIPTQMAKTESNSEDNEYQYILIVMSFYGVFLLGIVLGYINWKRHERKDDTLFLYDDRGEWAGLKSVHMPLVFSALPESMVPTLSCAMCSMENSVNSETAQAIQLTVEEEEVDGTENLFNGISGSGERSTHPPNESPC